LERSIEKIRLGRTNIHTGRLALGGIPIQRVSEEDAAQMVVYAVEKGIEFIDTSRAYTTSEHRIGLAMRQVGKKPVLATKSLDRTADGILRDIETSLKELCVDSIDIYQNHGVRSEEDYQQIIGPGGALEGMLKAKNQGLIKHIGVTSHSLDLLEKILGDDIYETMMACYSFLEPAAANKVLPKAKKKDVGVIAMKALSGGVIENPVVALKYALTAPDIVVLVGMEYPRYLDQIWDVCQGNRDISQEEQKQIEAIQAACDKEFCRRCDYCLPCPQGIPIQFVLSLRSIIKCMGPQALNERTVRIIEKAKQCAECGECEPRCPYELPIPELIKSAIGWAEKAMENK
jgi:predicted aldo/keto reductase-like oxidoreductase